MISRGNNNSTATADSTPPPSPPPSGRRRRMRIAAFAAGAAAVGLTLTTIFAFGASASTHTKTNRSGLPWDSGVYLPNATPASINAFGTWRGTAVDVVTVWPNRGNWNAIVNPAWLYRRWQGTAATVVFTEPMLPENAGASIAACAAGSYNSHWRQFGTNISAYGLGSSIIRLGWEFNGNWYIWRASNPAAWARCWQQIVTSARATAPGLQWDWNVNRGAGAGLADPTMAYPGDAYVNTIGVDSYDIWPPASTSRGWNTQLNGNQGLMYWLNFAVAHGKRFAVPEWGSVMPGTTAQGGHAGGDDPAYVNQMLGFFQTHSAVLAWESNFQSPTTRGLYRSGTQVPRAARAYRTGF